MKPYFGKQVIEAPRHNSSAHGPKVREYGRIVQTPDGYEYEGLSGRIPKLLRYYNRKEFSDKLAIIDRYLDSICGRSWDEVWSEMCRELKKGGRGTQHILEAHIDVATTTYRGVDGKVYVCDTHGIYAIGERHWRSQYYVEPETGILRKTIRVKTPERKYPLETIPISEGKEYRKIDGVWYFREIVSVRDTMRDPDGTLKEMYRHIEKKRQLGKKELRTLKIKNE